VTASGRRLAGHLRPRVEAADDRLVAVEGPLRRTIEQHRTHDRQYREHQAGTDQGPQESAHRSTVASAGMATLQSAAPIFPTADMDAMRAHYEALGFQVQVHHGGYATAARDAVRIHFRHVSDDGDEMRMPGAAYLAADDADALHAEWRRAGVGETTDLFDPGFGVWEAAHTDPDGNLLRFGSPVKKAEPA